MIFSTLYVEVIRLVGHALIPDNLGIELTGVVDRSRMSFVVDSNKAESCRLSLSPLEVIKEAPVIVSLNMVIRLGYELKLIVYEKRTEGVVVIAGTA